jgi:signal transduction histidine kinase
MTLEECQKVFQPLLKGKNNQETSLGLSIAYHLVVEEHRGKLECFSDLERGTEFVIRIPCLLAQNE